MITVSEARKTLEDLLQKSGYEEAAPEVNAILDVFKKFSEIKVDCSHDDFLFQCGIFDFTGERLFYWDIVRQFMVEKNKVYSHMEQLHYEVKFEPVAELEDYLAVEWSGADLNQYFEKLRNMQEVIAPFEKYRPRSVNIFQELV